MTAGYGIPGAEFLLPDIVFQCQECGKTRKMNSLSTSKPDLTCWHVDALGYPYAILMTKLVPKESTQEETE